VWFFDMIGQRSGLGQGRKVHVGPTVLSLNLSSVLRASILLIEN
jgi:hypothetical protein